MALVLRIVLAWLAAGLLIAGSFAGIVPTLASWLAVALIVTSLLDLASL